MEQNEVYNLKPFRFVVIGYALSTIINSAVSLFTDNSTNIQIFSGVCQIICWIYIFIGIRGVKKYSGFDKCYRAALWLIGISVGIVGALFISSAISYSLLFVILILSFLFILVALAFSISFFYNLFKGMEIIALQYKEKKIAKNADTLWLVYIWTAIISVCLAPIMGVIFSSFDFIVNVVEVIQTAIYIVICVFIYKFYNMFDGREIPTEPINSEELSSTEILRI